MLIRSLAAAALVASTLLFGAPPHAALAQTAGTAQPGDPRALFSEDTSPRGFAETIVALKTAFEAAGWSVLSTHDMAATLAEKGHKIMPVVIIEPCSGKYSVPLLQNDATRYVASLIPCRVAVYETAAGKVVVSRMNTVAMAGMMEPSVADIMRKAGGEVDDIIAKALKGLGK